MMGNKIFMTATLVLVIAVAGLASWGYTAFKMQKHMDANLTAEKNFKEISIELRLGEKSANLGGIEITPLEVVSDSRCPIDVQCIWAGTVDLKVLVKTKTLESEISLGLGESKMVDGYSLTLTDVEPPERSVTKSLEPKDYRFTFKITKASN